MRPLIDTGRSTLHTRTKPRKVSQLAETVYDDLLFNGRVRLIAFGQYYDGAEQDWTFRQLQKPADADTLTSVTRYLPEIASAANIPTIYAPSPAQFNAEICPVENLTVKIPVTRHAKTVLIYRGVNADGVILRPGKTFGISAAGCPVVILVHPPTSQVGVAHAGLKSSFDEGIFKGEPRRRHHSVVTALLEAMGCLNNGKEADVQAAIAFPIDPDLLTYRWDHPQFGTLNQWRSSSIAKRLGIECTPGWFDFAERMEGKINLGLVLHRQLEKCGVMPENIQIIPAPNEGWYTTRGEHPNRRNLILAKCIY